MKIFIDSLVKWVGENLIFGAKKLRDSIVLSSIEKQVDKRKKKRDAIVKQIEKAQEVGDHEKLEKLYIALHFLDSSI